VDANVVVKVVIYEDLSEKARALMADAKKQGRKPIAPVFLEVEVDSTLRKKVTQGKITPDEADRAFQAAMGVPVILMRLAGQRKRTWELSKRFSLGHVYDAVYLALADLRGCEFWTADEKLYNAVKSELSFVKWLGNYSGLSE